MANRELKLTVVRGKSVGRVFHTKDETTLVGRKDTAARLIPGIDLEEEDLAAKVSRRHANIHVFKDSIVVEDLGSLNGTAYMRDGATNLIPSGERAEVKIGDDLVFGEVVLKLSE